MGGRARLPPNYRLRRNLTEAAAVAFAVVLIVWTLAPIYNMVMVSLESAWRRVHQQHLAGATLAR